MDDDLARRQGGREAVTNVLDEIALVIARSITKGSLIASCRSAATKVTNFQ
jgi:hypothetical protein